MVGRTRGIFALFTLLLNASLRLFAEVDDLNERALASYSTPVRWENVEGAPYWISGVKPLYSTVDRMHQLKFAPAAFATVQIPRGESLRVVYTAGRSGANLLEYYISYDAKLFAEHRPLVAGPDEALIKPPLDRPAVLEIRLAAQAESEINAALFISRHTPMSDPAQYRDMIALPLQKMNVQALRESTPETWCHWPANTRFVLRTANHRRIALEMRLLYRTNDVSQLQQWLIFFDAGGQLSTRFYEESAETASVIELDGEARPVTRAVSAFIDIPPNTDEITLRTTANLIVRASGFPERQVLFAHNQNLEQLRLQERQQGELLHELLEQSDRGQAKLGELNFGGISEIERFGRLLALDNRKRESGLLAARLVEDTTAAFPHRALLRRTAQKFWGFHTFYRNLVPTETGSRGQKLRTFVVRTLADPFDRPEQFVLAQQHLPEWITRLDKGVFVPVLKAPVVYRAFPQTSAGRLQIAVLAPLNQDQELFVRLDDKPPMRLRTSTLGNTQLLRFRLSGADAVLSAWRANPIMSSPFLMELPDEVVSAGAYELDLDASVRQVAIWSMTGATNIEIALRQRVARPFQLSEAALEQLIVPGTFSDFVARVNERAEIRTVAAFALGNHWLPLVRVIQQDASRFNSEIAPEKAELQVRHEPGAVDTLLNAARAHEERGEWLLALETWSDVSARTNSAEAKIGRVNALEQLGETFLAEQLLRGLFSYSQSDELRTEARGRLAGLWANDPESIRMLASAVFVRVPTYQNLASLISALVQNGDFELAVTGAMLLPEEFWRPSDVLLAAARSGWWSMFQRASSKVKQSTNLVPASSLTLVENLVVNCAGGRLVYAIGRDLPFQMFLATTNSPVIIRTEGPMQLQIETRLLHTNRTNELRDWVRVDGQHQPVLTAVTSKAAEGLQLLEYPSELPGTKTLIPISLDAGTHELRLRSQNSAMLVRVFAGKPLQVFQPNSVLPPLTARTVKSELCRDCLVVIPTSSERKPRVLNAEIFADPPSTGEGNGVFQPIEASESESVDAPALLEQLLRTLSAFPLAEMNTVLWIAENRPDLYSLATVVGEKIARDHSSIAELRPLLQRLLERTKWQAIPTVEKSAGERYLDMPQAEFESPALRVRKALLSLSLPGERTVSGFDRLGWYLALTQATQIDFSFRIEDVPYSESVSTSISFQVDDLEPSHFELTADQSSTNRSESIPAGRHTIRVWMNTPVVNRFLRATTSEKGQPFPGAIRRAWHLASSEEPVRLQLAGPATLRVDRWRQSGVEPEYYVLSNRWNTLELRPAEGDSEALFRFSVRVETGPQPQVQPREVPRTVHPVAPPLLALPVALPPILEVPAEPAAAGGEDGTWSLFAGAYQRKALEEQDRTEPDRFLEFGAAHRYYSEKYRNYFRTEALVRVREHGGPVIGVRESILHDTARWPLSIGVDAELFGQTPDYHSSEGAAYLAGHVSQRRNLGTKTYHIPRASLFAREFTLGSSDNYDLQNLDHDTFSPYRKTHRWGWQGSDSIVNQPWLDTLWSARLSVTSNEDFSPDNAGVYFFWEQLLDPFSVSAGYSFLRFFSDRDRSVAYNRNSLHVGATFERWRAKSRYEAGFRFRHDIEAKDDVASFFIAWHFGRAREYHDFYARRSCVPRFTPPASLSEG